MHDFFHSYDLEYHIAWNRNNNLEKHRKTE